MKHFVTYRCPGCGEQIKARGAKEVFHSCRRRQWKLTEFLPVVEPNREAS